uniref:Uncharacterized protein n=1 Tax=Strix occidentalis caurina TaxID=311401 RepID=A0A8D0ERT6_STROC
SLTSLELKVSLLDVGAGPVLWFNPSQQLSTTQTLAHSLPCPSWMGRESERSKTHGLR